MMTIFSVEIWLHYKDMYTFHEEAQKLKIKWLFGGVGGIELAYHNV